jgi:hypothetical protein
MKKNLMRRVGTRRLQNIKHILGKTVSRFFEAVLICSAEHQPSLCWGLLGAGEYDGSTATPESTLQWKKPKEGENGSNRLLGHFKNLLVLPELLAAIEISRKRPYEAVPTFVLGNAEVTVTENNLGFPRTSSVLCGVFIYKVLEEIRSRCRIHSSLLQKCSQRVL